MKNDQGILRLRLPRDIIEEVDYLAAKFNRSREEIVSLALRSGFSLDIQDPSELKPKPADSKFSDMHSRSS